MQSVDIEAFLTALNLPQDARVDKRVPKKLLLEHGAPTAADKRKIQDGIEELLWVAALKPTNIGVSAFRDSVREYLEIAVMVVTLRAVSKPERLIELVHRAIPYPLVLVTYHGGSVNLSLAHKRWSQGESGKIVIEELRSTAPLRLDAHTPQESSFLSSLSVSGLPRRDLFALYQGWLDRVVALEVAVITGVFAPLDSAERALTLRNDLDTYVRLHRDIAALRARAAKEKQLNRRVEVNLEIKRLESHLRELAANLMGEISNANF